MFSVASMQHFHSLYQHLGAQKATLNEESQTALRRTLKCKMFQAKTV